MIIEALINISYHKIIIMKALKVLIEGISENWKKK
jgi:hypothetical protein